MSTTTTNYGLIKPGTDDPILIGQINDNMDTIDAALKENADAIENKPDAADIPTPSTAAPAMDGTGSAGTSSQYARADHVHPSDTSKQNALSSTQLAAVNSGITAEGVAQIETNKNNILWNYTETSYTPNNANVYEYTGISFTVPANEVYEFYAADRNDSSVNDIFSTGIIVSDNSSNVTLKASAIAENSGTPAQAPNFWLRTVSGITPKRTQNTTYYVWVSRVSTSTNGRIVLAYRKMVIT